VCTLTRSETSEVVGAFETGCPEFEPAPFLHPFEPGLAPAPTVRLTHEPSGGNGMFIAAWIRKEEPCSEKSSTRPER
jgi:16S rRNA C967 or C1407 C5-methylase (RsmB/RsmF family)